MTQRQIIAKYLIEHKKLNSFDASYTVLYPHLYPRLIKQAPTRITELINKDGYGIISSPPYKNRSVDWILISVPTKKKQETVREVKEWVYVGNKAYTKETPKQGILI